MTEETEKPFSPAMVSALRAVARMQGNSTIAWRELSDEKQRDDRYAPIAEPLRQQGWKPKER